MELMKGSLNTFLNAVSASFPHSLPPAGPSPTTIDAVRCFGHSAGGPVVCRPFDASCRKSLPSCLHVPARMPGGYGRGHTHWQQTRPSRYGSLWLPVRFPRALTRIFRCCAVQFTYPDRTCYPVASCNLQDFYNLVDVYMDAVFHPKYGPTPGRRKLPAFHEPHASPFHLQSAPARFPPPFRWNAPQGASRAPVEWSKLRWVLPARG